METVNITDVQRGFGKILLKVQESPVEINNNGEPVAVILSAIEYEAMQAKFLELSIQQGLKDLEMGNVRSGSKVFKELREKI